MLRELVTEILAREPDIRVSAVAEPPSGFRALLADTMPDALILSDGHGVPDGCAQYLAERHGSKMLGLSDDAHLSVLYEFRRVSLGELSPAALVATLRGGEP